MSINDTHTLWRRLLKNQVIRFILSAGVGFIADITAYYILYHNVFTNKTYTVFGMRSPNDIVSLAVSFFIGVVINFLITKYLVFSASTLSPSKQFIRFVSVAILGFFANLAMLKLFIHYLQMYPPVARPAAALSLFFASFFVHKFFSFNISLRHHAARSHRQ